MEEEDLNDIVLCGCFLCKFQMRRQCWIAEDHVKKYGTEDTIKYTAWIDAQLQGQGHTTQPDMTPNIRASLVHCREAKPQAMEGQASTSNQPRLVPLHMDTQEDVWEDQMAMEEGIADMLPS